MNDPIVTIAHVRKISPRLCARGVRTWFERYGLNFRQFLLEGYPASVIEATGDAYGIQIAALARSEYNQVT